VSAPSPEISEERGTTDDNNDTESASTTGATSEEAVPTVVNLNQPLWKQGWSGNTSQAAVATPRGSQSQQGPPKHIRISPVPAARGRRTSAPEPPIYENLNPFSALRRSLDETGARGPQSENLTQPAQSNPSSSGAVPKSILKKNV